MHEVLCRIFDYLCDKVFYLIDNKCKDISKEQKIKDEFEKCFTAIEKEIQKDNFSSVISKSIFFDYINKYNTIENIFNYVFSQLDYKKEHEDDFIILHTKKCIKYLNENNYVVDNDVSNKIYNIFRNILFEFKNFQAESNIDKAILYHLEQQSIILKERNKAAVPDKKEYNHTSQYIEKYKTEKIFWWKNNDYTLHNLYMFNRYVFLTDNSNSGNLDLETLISNFINGEICEYLYDKYSINRNAIDLLIISAPPGYGKTSLVSRLANDYPYICVLNLSKYKNLTFKEIIKKLEIDMYSDHVFVLDGLEEINCGNFTEIEDFVSLLNKNSCRGIITCRTPISIETEIAHSLNISLCAFNKEQAIKWLNKYKCIFSSFDLEKWKNSFEKMTESLSDVIFIPLILYICVTQDIIVNNWDSIAYLYDLLFNFREGEIKFCSYNHQPMDLEKWSELRKKAKQCAINCYKGNNEVQLSNNEIKDLYNYFGLIFSSNTYESITFVHSTIWQYFYAKIIYDTLCDLKNISKNEIWSQIGQLVKSDCKIDKEIIGFVVHFIEKGKYKDKIYSFLGEVIFNLPTTYFIKDDSVLDNISVTWSIFFNIYTEICYKYHNHRNDLKCTFSSQTSESLCIFKKLTLLSDSCPVYSFIGYNFDNINFEHVNFSHCNLNSITMRNANFKCSNLSYSFLVGVYANSSDFTGANLSFSDLKIADFSNSILCAANLKKSNLNGAFFINAILDRADLRGCTLLKTKFNNATLFYASIDAEQMGVFGLDLIFSQSINVYDGDKKLTKSEIEQIFKNLFPVKYLFWEHGLNGMYQNYV